jgi:hypothetical protein
MDGRLRFAALRPREGRDDGATDRLCRGSLGGGKCLSRYRLCGLGPEKGIPGGRVLRRNDGLRGSLVPYGGNGGRIGGASGQGDVFQAPATWEYARSPPSSCCSPRRREGKTGPQTVVFLAGGALPWIGEVLYVSGGGPFPGLDLPSIGFAAMGALVLLGMSRFALFDIVPVARTVIVERMSDGIIVLDARERIVDINPAAQGLLGTTAGSISRLEGEVFAALRYLLPRAALGGACACIEKLYPDLADSSHSKES